MGYLLSDWSDSSYSEEFYDDYVRVDRDLTNRIYELLSHALEGVMEELLRMRTRARLDEETVGRPFGGYGRTNKRDD